MSKFFAVAAAGVVLLAMQSTEAAAIPVTFNPANAGLGTSPNGFTADSFGLLDYATTTIGGPASNGGVNFSETGFLNITSFSFNGQPVSPPGLASTGTGGYSLYFKFTATGTQASGNLSPGQGPIPGKFDMLSFSLIGGNGNAVFTQTPTGFAESGTSGEVTLATGMLATPSSNTTSFQNAGSAGISASVSFLQTTFNPATGTVPAFFVSPNPFNLNLDAAFNNRGSAVSVLPDGNGFRITAGGGDASFIPSPVPEPMTLTLLGTGLAAVGLLRRRRK